MDREHWKKMLPIIEAFVKGDQIEFRPSTNQNWSKIDTLSQSIVVFATESFRIVKPKQRVPLEAHLGMGGQVEGQAPLSPRQGDGRGSGKDQIRDIRSDGEHANNKGKYPYMKTAITLLEQHLSEHRQAIEGMSDSHAQTRVVISSNIREIEDALTVLRNSMEAPKESLEKLIGWGWGNPGEPSRSVAMRIDEENTTNLTFSEALDAVKRGRL